MGSALCNMVTGPHREGWSRKDCMVKRHYFVGSEAEYYYGFRSLCGDVVSGSPRLVKDGGPVDGRCKKCERRRARRAKVRGA